MRRAYRSDSVARHHVAANGSRSAKSAGSSASVIASLRRRVLVPVVVDPVGDRLVEVPHQDLLVAERELAQDARTRAPAGCPSSVPASCSANSLNTTAATSCSTRSRTVVAGLEVQHPLEHGACCARSASSGTRGTSRGRSGSRGSGRSGSCRCPTGRPGPGSPPAAVADVGRRPTARAGRCGSRPRSGTWTPARASTAAHRRCSSTRCGPSSWKCAHSKAAFRVAHARPAPAAGAARARGSTPGTRRAKIFQLRLIVGAELVALGHPVERVAVERGDHRAEELAQRLARRRRRG